MNSQGFSKQLPVILAVIACSILAVMLLRPIADPDFFWHLATGRWIVEHVSLPASDPFTYTTPSDLGDTEYFTLTGFWLSQILYYGIYFFSGWNGFIMVRFIIIGMMIYFIYCRSRNAEKTIFLSVLSLTMIVFVQIYPLERPQVYSFLFFAVLLFLLERQVKGKDGIGETVEVTAEEEAEHKEQVNGLVKFKDNRTLFYLPLLMLVWANMHGGYVLGQAIIMVYLLVEGVKFLRPSLNAMSRPAYTKFVVSGVAGILVSLINPNTYMAVIVVFTRPEYITSQILEYDSTITAFKKFHSPYIPVYWALLCVALASIVFRFTKKRLDIADVILLSGLGYFSFTNVRYMAFFLLWAVPLLSLSLTELNRKSIRYICVILSLSTALYLVASMKEIQQVNNVRRFRTGDWISNYYPGPAVTFMKENDLKGNMYNYYDWGGYLIWKLYPEKKVFVDSRNLSGHIDAQSKLIDRAVTQPEIMGMPFYKGLIDSYKIKYMVVPLYGISGELLNIVKELLMEKEWFPVFFHGNSVIFVKDTPENYGTIRTYSVQKQVFVDYLITGLDTMIENSPGHFYLYLVKGDLYQSQGRWKEAQKEYEKVLGVPHFDARARERLGSMIFEDEVR